MPSLAKHPSSFLWGQFLVVVTKALPLIFCSFLQEPSPSAPAKVLSSAHELDHLTPRPSLQSAGQITSASPFGPGSYWDKTVFSECPDPTQGGIPRTSPPRLAIGVAPLEHFPSLTTYVYRISQGGGPTLELRTFMDRRNFRIVRIQLQLFILQDSKGRLPKKGSTEQNSRPCLKSESTDSRPERGPRHPRAVPGGGLSH